MTAAAAAGMGPATAGAPRSRLVGPDALRAFATVAVVGIHASAWPLQDSGDDYGLWHTWVDTLTRFAVPAFILVSGLLLGHLERGRRPTSAWLGRRLRRAAIPLMVWLPVYAVLGWSMFGVLCPSWSRVASCGTLEPLQDWLRYGAGHLWFLLVIPQLYVVFLLWPPRWRGNITAVLAAVAVQVLLGAVRIYLDPGQHSWDWFLLDYGIELFPFWIGYFAIGVYAGERLRGQVPALPAATALLLVAATAFTGALDATAARRGVPLPGYAGGSGGFVIPLMLPYALCISLLLLGPGAVLERISGVRQVVHTLSRHSLGIYVLHPIVLNWPGMFGTRVLQGTGRSWAWVTERHVTDTVLGVIPIPVIGFLVMVAVTILVTLLLVWAVTATPLAVTIGERQSLPDWWPHRSPAQSNAQSQKGAA